MEAGEDAATRDRHLAWYLSSAERWRGATAARPAPDGRAWRRWLRTERDNLRAALDWSLERDPEAGLRLLLALANYVLPWSAAEDVRWLDRLLARAPRATALRGQALLRAADMLRHQGRLAEARGRLEEGETVVRVVGGAPDGLGLGRLRLQQAQLAAAAGDVAGTRARYAEALALARASGDLDLLQGALSMGLLALAWDDDRSAGRALEECLALARARHDAVGVAGATIRLGIVARLEGNVERAHDLLRAGVAAAQAAGSAIHLAVARAALGDLARQHGDAAGARAQYRALLAAAGEHDADEVGSMAVVSEAVSQRVIVCHIGVLAVHEGAFSRGVRLLGAALPGAQAYLRVSCPDVHRDCAAALRTARTALGGQAADSAWREGLAMSLEPAVAQALGVVEGTACPEGSDRPAPPGRSRAPEQRGPGASAERQPV